MSKSNRLPNGSLLLRWRVVFVSLGLFAIATIITLVFNIAVDPYAQYGTGLVRPVSWTTRATKVALLTQRSPQPRLLILGSSRSMKIEPRYVNERSGFVSFNAAVSSARVEDFLAFFRYAVHDLKLPVEEVIVGLDLEAFHNALPPDHRFFKVEELYRQVPNLFNLRQALKLISDGMGQPQTHRSLRSLQMYLMDSYPPPKQSFAPDGYMTYLILEKQKAAGRFDLQVHIEASKKEYTNRFTGFSKLAPWRIALFGQFLSECAKNGISVKVFITTLHPEVVEAVGAVYHLRMRELLAALVEFQGQYSFSFFDASDVSAYSGSLEGFFDGGHIDEQNSRLIVDQLYPNGKR